MKRVLVTGASGFIGRRTLPLLVEQGWEVHAATRRSVSVEGVRWHACDLLESTGRRRLIQAVQPSHLLHLAWFAAHGAFWSSPENLSWVAATLDLTREFTEAGGQRAAFAGSCAEYEWKHGACIEGLTPLVPATLYGASKDATRRVVEAYGRTSGLAMAWARIFHLYGFDEDPGRLVVSVARALLQNREAKTTHGEQIRDLSLVDDVAAALVATLASEVTGAVNIGSGEGVPLRHVIELIGELTSRGDLLRIGAVPLSQGEPPVLIANVERLHDDVGFRPRHDLVSGLRMTIEAIRETL